MSKTTPSAAWFGGDDKLIAPSSSDSLLDGLEATTLPDGSRILSRSLSEAVSVAERAKAHNDEEIAKMQRAAARSHSRRHRS